MFRNPFALLFLLSFASTVCIDTRAATIDQLTATPLVDDVKISPSGDFIAVRIFNEGKHALRVLARDGLDIVGGLDLSGRNEIGLFDWANDERIVGKIYQIPASEEQPRFYGELFATNYDGSRRELIFGYRADEDQVGSHIRRKKGEFAWGDIVDLLPDEERYILVSVTEMSPGHDRRPILQKLDIYRGLDESRLASSRYPFGEFYTDSEGAPRLITSETPEGFTHVLTWPDEETGWIDIPADLHGPDIDPVAIGDDGTFAYVLDARDHDKAGLYKLSLDGESFQQVYVHDNVDIRQVTMSTDGRSVYAMRADDGYPSYLIFSGVHEEAQLFKRLLQTFPGNLVSIRSRTTDGRYWIVRTGTDTDEGSFHLFDRDENAIMTLFTSRPEVDPAELAPMQPISYESFDGTVIHGYFTAARRSTRNTDAPAPLVVLVHGGPFSRVYWGYDQRVQVLATHGYSVLQVNFRGSSGYGRSFAEAGYREWGDAVQRDIIAGTHWAIDTKRATPGNICIMGASFGAYSALMNAMIEPDLYACAIANAGIYDLELMYSRGDVKWIYGGKEYLEKAIGRDKEELRRFSPVDRVASLEAPVLIAHGKQDERAPIVHARRLREALEKHDKSFEWFIKDRESHGFYDNTNRVEYLQTALEFLDAHIGER